jgi:DNA-binding NtrC family response regulator
MPAQIIVVDDDAAYADEVGRAFMAAGHEVRVFPDPLASLDALEAATRVELLITRVEFPAGRSNGAALALMARQKRPGVKVLFVCRSEYRKDVEDLGEVLEAPAPVSDIVAAAAPLLACGNKTIGDGRDRQSNRSEPARLASVTRRFDDGAGSPHGVS